MFNPHRSQSMEIAPYDNVLEVDSGGESKCYSIALQQNIKHDVSIQEIFYSIVINRNASKVLCAITNKNTGTNVQSTSIIQLQ